MAKKKISQDVKAKLQLRAVEVLSASLHAPAESKQGDVEYQFDIGIEHRINQAEKLVFVVVSVSIREDDCTDVLGSLSSSCIFEIENFGEVVQDTDGKPQLPVKLASTLNDISISTTR